LEPLTNPPEGEQAFHVVAPSLPNYGFSEGVNKVYSDWPCSDLKLTHTQRGFNLRHYGNVMNQLMLDLGYNQYVSQGGDWGSMITRIMGHYHDDHLKAAHVNMAAFLPGNVLKQPWLLLMALLPSFWPTKMERQGLKNAQDYQTDGNAYYRMHATRPMTVAYCLADSPVALLGWVYEKLLHWTDSYPFTPDEILEWVSIYWFSRAGPGASVRTYFESTNQDPQYKDEHNANAMFDWTKVLLGVSQFPKDLVNVPRILLRTLGVIGFVRNHTSGGHFAAYEKPELLVGDLREFYGPGGSGHTVVDLSANKI
jgi:pimeloyl-ACP methyl ester carboxylesterase